MARKQSHSLAVGGLAALAGAVGIGRFVYTPILPGMMADLGLSGGQAGLIASANYIGYFLGALAAAMPMPLSRRLVLALCMFFGGATTVAMAGLSGVWAMAALRFAGGAASAGVIVLASGIVLEQSAAKGDANAPSIHFAGVGVGIVLSALMVAIVQGVGLDWRVEWLITGLVALVLSGLAISKIEDAPGIRASAPAQARYQGGLPALITAYGLLGLGYVVTATFLVAIIRADPALHAIEPYAWLIVGVSAAFSVTIWLKVAARWGTLVAFSAACLLESVGVAASVGSPTPTGIVIAALFLGGTFMGATALGFLAARERVSGDPRRMLALMTASFGTGQIIGPAMAGFLHDRTGNFVLASYLAAAALVLATIFSLYGAFVSRRTAPPVGRAGV